MKSKKDSLQIKDLVTIGVFFVIYFVVMFATGMMGIVPILFLIWPMINAIVTGVIVMLFMAKVGKKWALFIFTLLTPLLMFAMGHTWVVAVHGLIIASLAEIIFRAGKFKSFKFNALAYATFSCFTVGSIMQMLLVKEQYKNLTNAMMPGGYFAKLEALISWPTIILVIIGAFIGGIIGAFIGKAMLKKHFIKAGIV